MLRGHWVVHLIGPSRSVRDRGEVVATRPEQRLMCARSGMPMCWFSQTTVKRSEAGVLLEACV